MPSRRLVAAIAVLLTGCFTNYVIRKTMTETNDGGSPRLTDPVAARFQARFEELRKVIQANPDRYFRAVSPVPCQLSDEAKQRLVLGAPVAEMKAEFAKNNNTYDVDRLNFALLEGSCEGGQLNGLVSFVAASDVRMKIGGTDSRSVSRRRSKIQLLNGLPAGAYETVAWQTMELSNGGVPLLKDADSSAMDSLIKAATVAVVFGEASPEATTGPSAAFTYKVGSELPFTTTALTDLVASGKIKKTTTYMGSNLQSIVHVRNGVTAYTLHGPMTIYIKDADGNVTQQVSCYQDGQLVKAATCPLD